MSMNRAWCLSQYIDEMKAHYNNMVMPFFGFAADRHAVLVEWEINIVICTERNKTYGASE